MKGLVLFSVLAAACHEEPTMVVRFEPTASAATGDLGARAAAKPDGAVARVDAGAVRAAECKSSDDCALVPADCCDCANGGKQVAVPKAKVAAMQAARFQRCKGIMCTMMLSTDPSCGQRAACVKHACALVNKK